MHSDSRMHSAYLLTRPLHEDDIVVELASAVLWTLLYALRRIPHPTSSELRRQIPEATRCV